MWLLQVLAYLTFTLHILAMQFTLGSVILMLVSWRAPHKATRFLGSGLPLGFSYLVTFGIPPLLFVQVIYGQFFYTSSVLIGAFWISVIPLLIIAYGASYWHKLTRDRRPGGQGLLVGLILLVILTIGFIYVNNLTLAQTPERWLDLYRQHPGGGTLNHGEPTLIWRYFFALSPALAVVGLALILRGGTLRAWGDLKEGLASHRLGFRAMVISTALVLVSGIGLFATLPDAMSEHLRGAWAPFVGTAAVFFGLALLLAWRAGRRSGLLFPVLAAVSMVGATACVVVLRDLIRLAYLHPRFDPAQIPLKPQWAMFVLFAVSLVAGIVFMIVFTKKTVSGMAAVRRNQIAGLTVSNASRS
jgi:hypothetical protein